MEVRPGYKQTEVGVIPEDWGVHTIGSVVSISVGRDLREEHYSTHQTNHYRFPVFSNTVANSGTYGFYDFPEYMGDSLTIVGRGVGLGTAFKRSGGFGAIGRLLVLFPHRGADAAFLAEYINHRVTIFIESGGIPQLTGLSIAKYRVPLPPTKIEQESIAEALSDADGLIESLEQLAAKKRQIKHGAMQELLTGKRRLPGFTTTEVRDSEIGPLPGEWSVLEIGQIADVKTGPFGSSLHERDYVDDGTPIITVEHLAERGITRTNLPMVSEKDRRRLATYSLEEGDLVFSRVGSVDRNARVSDKESGWLFSGRLLRVRASSRNVDTRFLSYQFHLEAFKQRVKTVAVGQTMASLNTQILRRVLICLPSLCEQSAIAGVLSAMDDEIALAEARLAKARDLKQGMMQELLTGRIRLV